MVGLILLSVIVVASLVVFWLIPWSVRKLTRGVYTVRPLGLCCFGVMSVLAVVIGYLSYTDPNIHLSDIFTVDAFKKGGLFLILWIGSAFGVVSRTEHGRLQQIELLYAHALQKNDLASWEALCDDWAYEDNVAFLQKHPTHGKLVLDGWVRLLSYLETHPAEGPATPGDYYWAGYMYELGVNGAPDLSQARAFYEKALQVAYHDTMNSAEFEQYQDSARRRLHNLMKETAGEK